MLATPDLLHRGLKGYHDHLSKDAATFKVPNAGSERGKERRFTPTAWNSRSIPASCLKFREICKEQMEARYAVTENAVPSAVVCIAIQLNPSLKNSSFFRSAAAAARAQVYYNCLFSDALEIVLKRRVTSGSLVLLSVSEPFGNGRRQTVAIWQMMRTSTQWISERLHRSKTTMILLTMGHRQRPLCEPSWRQRRPALLQFQ